MKLASQQQRPDTRPRSGPRSAPHATPRSEPRSGPPRRRTAGDPLAGLRNIGPAMRADLALLGIETLAQLAAEEPDALYAALQVKTGQRQDPCVWDVFAAAIHQARTGEARDWWTFTPQRKARQAAGRFPVSPVPPEPSRAKP